MKRNGKLWIAGNLQTGEIHSGGSLDKLKNIKIQDPIRSWPARVLREHIEHSFEIMEIQNENIERYEAELRRRSLKPCCDMCATEGTGVVYCRNPKCLNCHSDPTENKIRTCPATQKKEFLEKLEGLKWKCDGENGCGYDGTTEDKQYICGGPITMKGLQLHQIIRVRNLAINEVLNLLTNPYKIK